MGPYQVMLVRLGGSRESVGHPYDQLGEACRVAFMMADALMGDGPDRSADPPVWVSVFAHDRLELSVQVGPALDQASTEVAPR